jgi:hypothetical protein
LFTQRHPVRQQRQTEAEENVGSHKMRGLLVRELTQVSETLGALHWFQVGGHTRDHTRSKRPRPFDAALVAPASADALQAHCDGGMQQNGDGGHTHALRKIHLRNE